MENRTQNDLTVDFTKMALKFYDSTLSILLILMLFLDLFLTSINYLNEDVIFFIPALLIICIDILFKYEPIANFTFLNKIMNKNSKLVVEKFIKGILYLLLLYFIITSPPGVPPSFILPIASIDFYFVLAVLIITGLYYSIYPILQLLWKKNFTTP